MDNDTGLFAVFLEATQGAKTVQWMLFPPSMREHGSMVANGSSRFMKRRLEYADHRAKWETVASSTYDESSDRILSQLAQYESTSWTIRRPIVIRLELDDYQKAWTTGKITTPYKALRHVNKVANSRGYKVN